MSKDEMIFVGGELDGLTLNASDKTMVWPINVVFEMLLDDGRTPHGADEIPDFIMKTKKIKYTLLHSDECPNGDAFVQYMEDGTEECQYDMNKYSVEPTDPFCPEEFKNE
jgi:hypothetical protein